MGSAKSERKAKSSRLNGAKAKRRVEPVKIVSSSTGIGYDPSKHGPRLCQAGECLNQGSFVQLGNMEVYLCDKHRLGRVFK